MTEGLKCKLAKTDNRNDHNCKCRYSLEWKAPISRSRATYLLQTSNCRTQTHHLARFHLVPTNQRNMIRSIR